jgi:hypothetical protein
MTQKFTHNDLLKLIYNEVDDCCTEIAIKKEIHADDDLANQYRELRNAKALLTSNELAPNADTVQAIINKSKSTKKEFAS